MGQRHTKTVSKNGTVSSDALIGRYWRDAVCIVKQYNVVHGEGELVTQLVLCAPDDLPTERPVGQLYAAAESERHLITALW